MKNDETMKNISRINAKIYDLMFLLYDQMAQIKEQLDLLIKSGKTYYKGYKITGDIGFAVDEEDKNPEVDDYFEAESEWKLVFEYGKKLPTKLKALDLWKNYSKDELSIPMDYICRVTYGFLHPKKEEDEKSYWANYKIPYEIFKNAKPEDFYHCIKITIGKFKLRRKFTEKERKDFRMNKEYFEKLKKHPERQNFFWFEKRKLLKLAKKMLEYELSINSTSKKIRKDFEQLVKNGYSIFDKSEIEKTLDYNFHHPFGIVTKEDSLLAHIFHNLMTMNGLSADNEENYFDDEVPQWADPMFFRNEPFNKIHLCFSMHGLYTHCDLTTKEVLKMKLRNFSPYFEIRIETNPEEAEEE